MVLCKLITSALVLLGGIEKISIYTNGLTQYMIKLLCALKHANGKSVVKLHRGDYPADVFHQGPVIAFNVYDSEGKCVGATAVCSVVELCKPFQDFRSTAWPICIRYNCAQDAFAIRALAITILTSIRRRPFCIIR